MGWSMFARQRHRVDDLRADPPAPRHHRGRRAARRSCSGRSGAASPAWSARACSRSASQWRTALRAFTDLRAMFGGGRGARTIPSRRSRRPPSWFVAGQVVGVRRAWRGSATGPSACRTGQTAVAVALSFALALVACRVTGETDTDAGGRDGQDHPAHVWRAEPRAT